MLGCYFFCLYAICAILTNPIPAFKMNTFGTLFVLGHKAVFLKFSLLRLVTMSAGCAAFGL